MTFVEFVVLAVFAVPPLMRKSVGLALVTASLNVIVSWPKFVTWLPDAGVTLNTEGGRRSATPALNSGFAKKSTSFVARLNTCTAMIFVPTLSALVKELIWRFAMKN